MAADRIAERWDLAICSSKGYSVRAARRALVALAERNGRGVLVAHDFDKQGIGIADLIAREVPRAIDLGLRLDDIADERWDSPIRGGQLPQRPGPEPGRARREPGGDRLPARRRRHAAERVELNALVGREFIDWLEAKLRDHGIKKVVPTEDRWRRRTDARTSVGCSTKRSAARLRTRATERQTWPFPRTS